MGGFEDAGCLLTSMAEHCGSASIDTLDDPSDGDEGINGLLRECETADGIIHSLRCRWRSMPDPGPHGRRTLN